MLAEQRWDEVRARGTEKKGKNSTETNVHETGSAHVRSLELTLDRVQEELLHSISIKPS
jgi:hypothetical protein